MTMTEALVSAVMEHMDEMSHSERVEFIKRLTDEYCPQCGRCQPKPYRWCRCVYHYEETEYRGGD